MAFATFTGPDFTFEVIPPTNGDLAALLAERWRAATAAGRIACVYLTAVWCPPSAKLEKALTDPAMQRAFANCDLATFDIDAWDADTLKAAGYSAGSIPVFYIVDASGRPTGPKIGGEAWGENTVANMAPPLQRFFDAARGATPATTTTPTPTPTPAPSPPAKPPVAHVAPPPAPARKGIAIALVAVALAIIVVVAILVVRGDDKDRKAAFDRDQHDRIQKSVDEAVHHALDHK